MYHIHHKIKSDDYAALKYFRKQENHVLLARYDHVSNLRVEMNARVKISTQMQTYSIAELKMEMMQTC